MKPFKFQIWVKGFTFLSFYTKGTDPYSSNAYFRCLRHFPKFAPLCHTKSLPAKLLLRVKESRILGNTDIFRVKFAGIKLFFEKINITFFLSFTSVSFFIFGCFCFNKGKWIFFTRLQRTLKSTFVWMV